eukprot:4215830-Amphidinium_carterae.1
MFSKFRRCPNRPPEMERACLALDEETARDRQVQEERQSNTIVINGSCARRQKEYHGDPLLNYHVDVMLTLPSRTSPYFQHLPSTKMTYLASHGMPHVFWRYQSYIELAEEQTINVFVMPSS